MHNPCESRGESISPKAESVDKQRFEFVVQAQAAQLSASEAAALAEALQRGEPVDDAEFDRIYEGHLREASAMHWTSTEVVRRVVKLLSLSEREVVLDVGSGAGKFCLAGSLISPAQFVGMERRPELVAAAKEAQRALGETRATFICGDVLQCDWAEYDCIYMFNPFEEHLMSATSRVNNSVCFSQAEYVSWVEDTRDKFGLLKPGTRVVLFWGYGGNMYEQFRLLHRERHGYGELEVWEKKQESVETASARLQG
jgi:protein-L-isoaspartate O-methyltransferase